MVYFAICTVWPTKNQRMIKDMGLGWEEQSGDTIIAEDGTEIVEEGSQVRARDESSDDIVREQQFGQEKM